MAAKEKSLDTLIELRKREIDGLRRRMVLFEEQRAQFLKKISELLESLEKERTAAAGNVNMISFLNSYTKANKAEQKQYQQAVARVEKQMDELRDMIMNAFSEQKKLELGLKILNKRKQEKLNRQEQQLLDELGMQGYIRREG